MSFLRMKSAPPQLPPVERLTHVDATIEKRPETLLFIAGLNGMRTPPFWALGPRFVAMRREPPSCPPGTAAVAACDVPFIPLAVASEIACAPSPVSFKCQTPRYPLHVADW